MIDTLSQILYKKVMNTNGHNRVCITNSTDRADLFWIPWMHGKETNCNHFIFFSFVLDFFPE